MGIVNGYLPDVPLARIHYLDDGVRQDLRHDDGASATEYLVQNIEAIGLLNPLLVRQDGDSYVLISGHHRYRAAESVGLETVPVGLCDVSDEHAIIIQLNENLQRQNLHRADVARALWRLSRCHNMGDATIARLVPLDRTFIAECIDIWDRKALADALEKEQIDFATSRILRRIWRWFVECRKILQGEHGPYFYLCHEPAVFIERLMNGEQVTKEEAKPVLDHYTRWGVPHYQAAYAQMLEQMPILMLPYAQYVAPAFYKESCDWLQYETHDTVAYHQRIARSCAEHGLTYVAAPNLHMLSHPTIETIAATAPNQQAAPRGPLSPAPHAAVVISPSSHTSDVRGDGGNAVADGLSDGTRRRAETRDDPSAALRRAGEEDTPSDWLSTSIEDIVVPPKPHQGTRVVPFPTRHEDPPAIAVARFLDSSPTRVMPDIEALARYAMDHCDIDVWPLLRDACRARMVPRASE